MPLTLRLTFMLGISFLFQTFVHSLFQEVFVPSMYSSDLSSVLSMNDTVMKKARDPQKLSGLTEQSSHPRLTNDHGPGFSYNALSQISMATLQVDTTIVPILQMGKPRLGKSKVTCLRSQRQRVKNQDIHERGQPLWLLLDQLTGLPESSCWQPQPR